MTWRKSTSKHFPDVREPSTKEWRNEHQDTKRSKTRNFSETSRVNDVQATPV